MSFLADTFTACENSGLLKVIYFGSLILDIAFTLLPICLIILLMIDFGKAVISPSEEEQIKSTKLVGKRILYCILVFATPWIVDFIFSVLNAYDLGVEYTACLPSGNANLEKIAFFEEIEEAEEAKEAEEAAEKAKAAAEEQASLSNSSQALANSQVTNATSGAGKRVSGEPDPLNPMRLLYNSTNYEIYKLSNFSLMVDKDTGYSLGAWPSNTNVSNLSGTVKTYLNGTLMFPTTGDGSRSYTHNGIDIVADEMAIPIYSPVDGTIVYSEWGRTVNKGAKETAYSASIELDKKVTYNGVWRCNGKNYNREGTLHHIFLTHMTGIRYRTTGSSTKIKVKKGDLIGFMGIANGCIHLHMTLYEDGTDCGIVTEDIQKIYGLTGEKEAGK